MRLGTVIAALFLVAGSTTAVLAITEPKIGTLVIHGTARPVSDGATAPPLPALSIGNLIGRLEQQGYTNVTEVEREGGRYEVKATGADGRRVEVYVDAATGEIVATEVKR